jgi:hypothetical protein
LTSADAANQPAFGKSTFADASGASEDDGWFGWPTISINQFWFANDFYFTF